METYYERNKEYIKSKARDNYMNNPIKYRERSRKYYYENRDTILQNRKYNYYLSLHLKINNLYYY